MESDKLFIGLQLDISPRIIQKCATILLLYLFQIVPTHYNFTFMEQNEDGINSCERKLTVITRGYKIEAVFQQSLIKISNLFLRPYRKVPKVTTLGTFKFSSLFLSLLSEGRYY